MFFLHYYGFLPFLGIVLAAGGNDVLTLIISIFIAIGYLIIILVIGILKHFKIKKIRDNYEEKASKNGTTVESLIFSEIAPECLKICEFYRGKPIELEPYLKSCLKTQKINKIAYEYLINEYSK